MNTTISDEWDRLKASISRAAKPEAVRLRDELRERAEFEAWAAAQSYRASNIDTARDSVVPEWYVSDTAALAWSAWQAALAATGKQQVGGLKLAGLIAVEEADAVNFVHPEYGPGIFFTEDCRIDLAGASKQQVGGVQGDALLESLVVRWRAEAAAAATSDNALCQKIANCTMRLAAELKDTLAARQPVGHTFQAGVSEWMGQCFLPSLYSNMTERGDRLLEEVLELLQSNGYDQSRVATLVNYVFNRPAGEPAQEVGGVMVTLAGYCWVAGLDMHAAGDAELLRITRPEIMEKIRRKQEAKNALHFDTPLPGNSAPPAQAVNAGPGVQAIAAERERQITAEGFSRDRDQQYQRGELAKAATAYVQLAAMDLDAGTRDHIAWHGPSAVWPWPSEWWRPVDARRDLVRAGALIAAQIDLLDGGQAVQS